MKTAHSPFMPLATLFLCGVLLLRGEDWKTTDGKVYQKIKVVSSTPESVTILHKDGGAKIPLTKLNPDLQKRFNYDPNKAKAYADEQTKIHHPVSKPVPSTSVASKDGDSPTRPIAPSKTEHAGSTGFSESDLKALEGSLPKDEVDAILDGSIPEATSSDTTAQTTTSQAGGNSPKVFPSTSPNHHSEDDLVNSITGLRHDLSDPTYHTMAHMALEAQSLGPDPNDKNHHSMDEISGH